MLRRASPSFLQDVCYTERRGLVPRRYLVPVLLQIPEVTPMAEWAVLILVFAVVAGAWWLQQRFFETWQVAAIWCGAGLVIVVGLIIYMNSKISTTAAPWVDQYQIDEP